ncbi:MAG: histidine phosphatase family protein, partial [Anaerolineae bacterium]
MKVYFLRHGQANWPHWEGTDDERPLTKKGKKEVRQVAAFLQAAGIKLNVILSSPLPRAYQTAEIVAGKLDLEVTEEPV